MKHQNRVLKIIKRILVAFSAIVLVIMNAALIMYHNEILTALSVKQISDEQAFTIELHGDMYFDDLMKTEISTNKELETFLYNKLSLNFYGKLVNKHGCSAFYAKTPDGDILLCNDIDKSISDEKKTPVVMNMNLGKKSMVIGNAGEIVDATDGLNINEKLLLNATLYTACNGINENGLAIAAATASDSRCNDTDKQNLYDGVITTAVLNNASNVEEAIAFLENYDVVANYPLSHYMIGDAKGNIAVVEWIDGKMQVIKPDKNYMIMTNFPLATMNGFGTDRYNAYNNALSQCGGILTEEEALKLLAEHVIPGDECWSVVYNLTDGSATVCFRADYNNSFTYYLN